METTHQKAKSIFSDVKWPLKPTVLFSPFNTVGHCASLGAGPLCSKCIFNPRLKACDTPRLESLHSRGFTSGSVPTWGVWAFRIVVGSPVAARRGCFLRMLLDQTKGGSRMSCLQKEICSQHKSSHSFSSYLKPGACHKPSHPAIYPLLCELLASLKMFVEGSIWRLNAQGHWDALLS